MINMIDQIRQLNNWDTLQASEIALAFAEQVNKPGSSYTFNELATQLNDVQLVEALISAMRGAGLNASADSFIARGIDFGAEQTQAMLDSLAIALPNVFTAEVTATLKNFGRQSRWLSLGGISDMPSIEAIQTELDRYAGEQLLRSVKAKCDAAYEAASAEYLAGRFDSMVSSADLAYGGE